MYACERRRSQLPIRGAFKAPPAKFSKPSMSEILHNGVDSGAANVFEPLPRVPMPEESILSLCTRICGGGRGGRGGGRGGGGGGYDEMRLLYS